MLRIPLCLRFVGLNLPSSATASVLIEQKFIAVAGSQHSGKSQLARDLFDLLRVRVQGGVYLHPSVSQEIEHQGHPLGIHATPTTLMAYAVAHLRRERFAKPGLNILDRCLVDVLAYVDLLGYGREPFGDLIGEAASLSLNRLCAVIVLHPKEVNYVDTRTGEDLDFRQRMYRKIKEICVERELKIIEPKRRTVTDAAIAELLSNVKESHL